MKAVSAFWENADGTPLGEVEAIRWKIDLLFYCIK
jgi:hypothetical protein